MCMHLEVSDKSMFLKLLFCASYNCKIYRDLNASVHSFKINFLWHNLVVLK